MIKLGTLRRGRTFGGRSSSFVFRSIAHSLTHELAPHRVYRTELKII